MQYCYIVTVYVQYHFNPIISVLGVHGGVIVKYQERIFELYNDYYLYAIYIIII
jgi:hypothetical protein